MTIEFEKILEEIKKALKEKGLRNKDLAPVLQVSDKTVADIMAGRRKLSLIDGLKIEQYLGVDFGDAVGVKRSAQAVDEFDPEAIAIVLRAFTAKAVYLHDIEPGLGALYPYNYDTDGPPSDLWKSWGKLFLQMVIAVENHQNIDDAYVSAFRDSVAKKPTSHSK